MTPDLTDAMKREDAIRDLANNQGYEVDDGARVSEGSVGNGAYVQAWVWVSFNGTHLDKNKEEI